MLSSSDVLHRNDGLADAAPVATHEDEVLVSVLGGVVFGGDDKTSALSCATIDSLDDVNDFLLVLHRPVDLVVVSRALQHKQRVCC